MDGVEIGIVSDLVAACKNLGHLTLWPASVMLIRPF